MTDCDTFWFQGRHECLILPFAAEGELQLDPTYQESDGVSVSDLFNNDSEDTLFLHLWGLLKILIAPKYYHVFLSDETSGGNLKVVFVTESPFINVKALLLSLKRYSADAEEGILFELPNLLIDCPQYLQEDNTDNVVIKPSRNGWEYTESSDGDGIVMLAYFAYDDIIFKADTFGESTSFVFCFMWNVLYYTNVYVLKQSF